MFLNSKASAAVCPRINYFEGPNPIDILRRFIGDMETPDYTIYINN